MKKPICIFHSYGQWADSPIRFHSVAGERDSSGEAMRWRLECKQCDLAPKDWRPEHAAGVAVEHLEFAHPDHNQLLVRCGTLPECARKL